ncbi:MAG: hypothetical protein GWP70_06505 [Proteobacteria bacterium]|nr:hypothetical protein [Pseudomonadota bacterium]
MQQSAGHGLLTLAKVLGALALLLILLYAAYSVYVKQRYGQDLPFTELNVNGVAREYALFTPSADSATPLPLVILLNGGSAGRWRFPQQRQWQQLASAVGFVLAIPVGQRLAHNEGAWQLDTLPSSMQDIAYIDAMIEQIGSGQRLDNQRIYAVGYSLGSMFSYELVCHMSDRFAAVASFAGTMPVAPKACSPAQPVALLHAHGVQDEIIAYANSWDWKQWPSVGTMQDIPSLIAFWRKRYRCQQQSTVEQAGETHIVHGHCDQGVVVEHYRLDAGTHEWPATLAGAPTYKTLWSFLSRYAAPPTSAKRYYPEPSSSSVRR